MPDATPRKPSRSWPALALLASLACAGPERSPDPGPTTADAGAPDAGGAAARIEHVVILVQENHSFDSYFGLYCAGPTGTPFPTPCSGRGCCEQAPQRVPGRDDATSAARTCLAWQGPSSYLDDTYNQAGDPDHGANFEYEEMHNPGAPGSIDAGFLMDRFYCHNIQYAQYQESAAARVYPDVPASDAAYPLRTYHSLAANGALADRYFQPIAGASTSNDLFFARAGFVFQDNQRAMPFGGYTDKTLGDLLDARGVTWAVYLGGLDQGCVQGQGYPECVDTTDNPYTFTARYQGDRRVQRDLRAFSSDLAHGTLPAVSLLRALGSSSEHPESGAGGAITAGENGFIKASLDALNASPAAASTLVLITWDESGGFYDHVSPPQAFPDGCALPTTPVWSGGAPPGRNACALVDASHLADGGVAPQTTSAPEYFSNAEHMAGQEYYAARLALLALGPFARAGTVSHALLEHSSIVKFIEWNWLGHQSGQLGTRDQHVNNLGTLLDPALQVPEALADGEAECQFGGAPGTCTTASACAAIPDHSAEPGTCATGLHCCIDSPDVHDNPPVPDGYTLLTQAQVTPAMTTWAVEILHEPITSPMYSTALRTFGSLRVLARVEWHSPDFQNGVIHRGVTLYAPK